MNEIDSLFPVDDEGEAHAEMFMATPIDHGVMAVGEQARYDKLTQQFGYSHETAVKMAQAAPAELSETDRLRLYGY